MLQTDQHQWRRREMILCGILAAALLGALPFFLARVFKDAAGTDFPEFYAAGRHVLEHGTRQPDTILYYYLPSLDVAWALVAWMPLKLAAVVYYAFGCWCWVGLLRSVQRYLLPATPREDQPIVLLCAALLTLVSAVANLLAGAFHLLMVWLMIAGLGRIMQRRRGGALLLGMAIWLKLLPGIGVFYLLVKRRWAAAIASVAVALALDAGLSMGAYGPTQARTLHAQWWKAQAVGQLAAILESPTGCSPQSPRNQSTAAVARRLLTRTGMVAVDPVSRRVSLADLSPGTLKVVYWGFTLGLLGSLGWYWRQRGDRIGPPRWAAEVALVTLSTLWFSPVVLSYHPVAALPALAVVLGSHWESSRVKTAALLTWLVGLVLMGLPEARAAGEILWASLLLGVAVMVTGRWYGDGSNAGGSEPPRI